MFTSFGKWLLTLLFFDVLGYALCLSHGHLHRQGIAAVFCLGLIFLWTVFSKTGKELPQDKSLALLTAFSLCFFSFLISQDACMIYADQASKAFHYFKLANQINLGLSLLILASLLVPLKRINPQKLLTCLAVVMMLIFFTSRILVLFASAHPHIDVFVTLNRASEALFAGQNPYSIRYEDIYAGANGEPVLGYQPGLVLLLAPFWAIFHDVRAAYPVCDLMVVVFLLKIARQLKLSPALSLLLPLLWLAFPVSYFVLEQAWTDILLVGLSAFLLSALLEKRWLVAGVLGGLLSVTKYYPGLVPFFSALYIYREAGLRPTLYFLISCAAVAALLFTPFLLVDAPALIHHTFSIFVGYAPRPDSFSLGAFAKDKWQYLLPTWIDGVATLITLVFCAFMLLRTKKPAFLSLTEALAATYLVFFLFAKQSFCNYYYFLAFFILLVLFARAKPLAPSLRLL